MGLARPAIGLAPMVNTPAVIPGLGTSSGRSLSHRAEFSSLLPFWIPAFAGMTGY